MHLVYFGVDFFANVLERLIDTGHHISLIVTSEGGVGDIPHQEISKLALHHHIDFFRTRHIRYCIPLISLINPDLIIVGGFPYRFPQEILSIPRYGVVNIHPSLLPKYRGPCPQPWHFLNGERESGVTIHLMDEHIDTGPIVAQEKIMINERDNYDSLCSKQIIITPDLVINTIEDIATGRAKPISQDESEASYHPMPGEEVRTIKWEDSTERIMTIVKAFGSLSSWATVEGRDILIYAAKPSYGTETELQPGTIIEESKAGLLVGTGDGFILITGVIQRR
jgi:methionyl-tRNA formyltransferase